MMSPLDSYCSLPIVYMYTVYPYESTHVYSIYIYTIYTYIHMIYIYYESWVVPAGVPSALADIGGELRQIIDSVKGRGGGVSVTKSIPEGGGGNGVEFQG